MEILWEEEGFQFGFKLQMYSLILLSVYTPLDRKFHGKAVRKKCAFSWAYKNDSGEKRQIFNGSPASGIWHWKDCVTALLRADVWDKGAKEEKMKPFEGSENEASKKLIKINA